MKFFSTFLCLGFLIFQGCSSASDDCEPGPIEYPNQQGEIDGLAYKNSLLDCRLPKVQTFEFNSFAGAEIVATQKTVFFISPETFFELDGSPIDGPITFSVLVMYIPDEIIACQLSTNGMNDTQTVEPLLGESIFFINATYNGNPVRMDREIMVFIPSENRDLELSLFNSPKCSDLECDVLWEKIPQSTVF